MTSTRFKKRWNVEIQDTTVEACSGNADVNEARVAIRSIDHKRSGKNVSAEIQVNALKVDAVIWQT